MSLVGSSLISTSHMTVLFAYDSIVNVEEEECNQYGYNLYKAQDEDLIRRDKQN